MDNLTHTLVGLMISRCGFDSWASKRAVRGMSAMMVLAANAPDIDGYPFFYSQLEYLKIHRGYTHSLAAIPVMTLLPIAIVCGITKQKPTLMAWFGCMLALLSHLALDWTNVYGIRMLLPFSDRWLRLDINNLVEPIVWAILLLAVGVPYVLSLASKEIGSRKASGGRRGWAWVALLLVVGYEGLRWDSHQRAVESMNALLYMDKPAKNVYAFPDAGGLMNWRGVVEGDDFFYELRVNRTGEFNMREATLSYKAPVTPELKAVQRTPVFEQFQHFNQVPFWRTSPLEDGTRVQLLDLRFGGFSGGFFMASAIAHPDGRVENAHLGR
jgi:inner membrane protein